MNFNNDYNKGMNQNTNTFSYGNTNTHNQNNFSTGFGNMGGLGTINIGDDPFAEI
jgi:hypothetical protein